MSAKQIATIILLIFVAVSLTVVVMRNTATPAAETEKTAVETKKDCAVVYYFHRTQRCPTCTRIEELTREIVRSQFAAEMASGALELHVINIEKPGYEHYENDYNLSVQSIVIARMKGGQQVKWDNLDKIWDLIGNEPEFNVYVAGAIRGALSQT